MKLAVTAGIAVAFVLKSKEVRRLMFISFLLLAACVQISPVRGEVEEKGCEPDVILVPNASGSVTTFLSHQHCQQDVFQSAWWMRLTSLREASSRYHTDLARIKKGIQDTLDNIEKVPERELTIEGLKTSAAGLKTVIVGFNDDGKPILPAEAKDSLRWVAPIFDIDRKYYCDHNKFPFGAVYKPVYTGNLEVSKVLQQVYIRNGKPEDVSGCNVLVKNSDANYLVCFDPSSIACGEDE